MSCIHIHREPGAVAQACTGAVMAGLLIAGCAVGPDFVRPKPPNAERYTPQPTAQSTVTADGQSQRFEPGAKIAAEDLILKRPLSEIPPSAWDKIIGRTVLHDIPEGEALMWSDLA